MKGGIFMKEKIKKYICMVTAVIAVIISIPVFAEGVSFSELKNMDYLSADEILWLEGLAHTYENKEYKWNRAESDMIESVIKIFNDNLIFKEQLFNEVPTENNENYEKIPKEYFCSIHTSDNIEYRLYWDSTDVFVTRVDINQKNISQGLFKYRNESLYTELKIILDEYAKETPKPVETEGFKLYNLQTLYLYNDTDDRFEGDEKILKRILEYSIGNLEREEWKQMARNDSES